MVSFSVKFNASLCVINVLLNISVCRDNYDIRNDPKQFMRLRGCRIIEGYLQILLFDNYNESSYDGISFPELREINDYLMFYRVFGLRTLSKLFPNLAVIGGKQRFQNYALIIYEMQDMQEIGLISLTDILDGAVRIEKNPQLCYASTIDWTLIAKKAKRDEHMILVYIYSFWYYIFMNFLLLYTFGPENNCC